MPRPAFWAQDAALTQGRHGMPGWGERLGHDKVRHCPQPCLAPSPQGQSCCQDPTDNCTLREPSHQSPSAPLQTLGKESTARPAASQAGAMGAGVWLWLPEAGEM